MKRIIVTLFVVTLISCGCSGKMNLEKAINSAKEKADIGENYIASVSKQEENGYYFEFLNDDEKVIVKLDNNGKLLYKEEIDLNKKENENESQDSGDNLNKIQNYLEPLNIDAESITNLHKTYDDGNRAEETISFECNGYYYEFELSDNNLREYSCTVPRDKYKPGALTQDEALNKAEETLSKLFGEML